MSHRYFSSLSPCRQRTQAKHSFRQLPRTISHLLDNGNASLGSEVAVSGWVRSIRKQKAVAFVSVNDGSSVDSMQVVAPTALAQDLAIGSSVSCEGVLQPSPGRNQSLELQASSIRLLGSTSTTYPIQKKAQSAEFLRNYPHLRTRTSQGLAMVRLRDKIMHAFREVYYNNGFVLVQPPIFTSNDCEGAGGAFRVTTDGVIDELRHATPIKTGGDALPVHAPVPEFFGRPTYLTVSTQLHLEALAASISRVYTISPVFRAEPSQTHRHVSEFSMVEAEVAFCEELEVVMSFVEQSLKEIVSSLQTSAASEISVLQDMQSKYGGHPFEDTSGRSGPIQPVDLAELHTSIFSEKVWERMTYLEAVKELESHIALNPGRQIFSHPVGPGLSLQSEHEKWLAGTLARGPLFVTDYPAALKPFYMRCNRGSSPIDARSVLRSPYEEHRTVSCFDLLVPRVGELVGGSLREERVDLLTDAMEQRNIPRESLQWYLDLRQYGSAPTGGFGLGFERLVSWLTGFENVRDCMPFPRAAGKILL